MLDPLRFLCLQLCLSCALTTSSALEIHYMLSQRSYSDVPDINLGPLRACALPSVTFPLAILFPALDSPGPRQSHVRLCRPHEDLDSPRGVLAPHGQLNSRD